MSVWQIVSLVVAISLAAMATIQIVESWVLSKKQKALLLIAVWLLPIVAAIAAYFYVALRQGPPYFGSHESEPLDTVSGLSVNKAIQSTASCDIDS